MPYQKAVLSLDDARKAMDRMLQEAHTPPTVRSRLPSSTTRES
jgi:hypothetical protein